MGIFGDNKTTEEMLDGKILVIKPAGDVSVPLFCDICKFPMKTMDDVVSFKKIGCCSSCEMRWSTSKLGNLAEGWKPDANTDGWEDYIRVRNIHFKRLINLK